MAFKELTGDIALDSGEIVKGKFQEVLGDIPLDHEGLMDEESAAIPSTKTNTQWDIKTKKPIIPGADITLAGQVQDQLGERATRTWDYMKDKFTNANEEMSILNPITNRYEPTEDGSVINYLKEIPTDTALSLGVGAGNIAGALEDVTFDLGLAAYKKAMPEEAQAFIYDRFLDFTTTKAGQLGLEALGKGLDAWNEFEDKNPDAAMEMGSMLNLMGASWGKKLIEKVGQRPIKDILNAGSSIVHDLGKITPKYARERIQSAVNKHFLKAINPPKGIGYSDAAIKKFKENAGNAVHSVVENKDILRLTDEFGNIADNRLPKTIHQFNESISQVKKKLFDQYHELAKVAGDKGLTVDLSDLFIDKIDDAGEIIEAPLNQIANSVAFAAMDKDSVDRAMELIDVFENRLDAGRMSVYEAEKLVSAANKFKSKVPGLDSQVADFVREKLNETMDSLVDSRYSNIKKEYGNLRAIEESVSKAAFADLKKGPGIYDIGTNIFAFGEIAKGLAKGMTSGSFGVGNIAKGLTEKAIQKLHTNLHKPNRRIKKMFESADKSYSRIGETPLRESDRIYADAVNTNVDNAIKRLEGQKMQALPEGAIRMGGPAPEPPPAVFEMPASLREFKSLKAAGKTDDGLYRWTDDVSKTGFTTKTSNPAELRRALKRTRGAAKDSLKATTKIESIEDIPKLTSQGKVGKDYHWRDDEYGGNFQTTSNDPVVVKKALEAKRKQFRDAGNKPIEPPKEQKPLNQEDWMKDLQKEIADLEAKKKPVKSGVDKIFEGGGPSETPTELLHTSSKPYKGGKPDKDAWFGNRTWYNEYVNDMGDGTFLHEFGDFVQAIEPPKGTRTLDIDFLSNRPISKESAEFMAATAKKARPNDKQLAKDLLAKKPEAIDEFIGMWTDGEGIPEAMRELGYGITKFGDEHFVLKEVVDKSKVTKTPKKDPKTGKLIIESKEDRIAKLKESNKKVKGAKAAQADETFSKMEKAIPDDLDYALDAWGGDIDDKAGFIKWLKSDKAYSKTKFNAELRGSITRLKQYTK